MTVIYELDPYPVKMYQITDIETDRSKTITTDASYVVIIVIIKFVWSHVRSCILDKAIMVVLISVKLSYI